MNHKGTVVHHVATNPVMRQPQTHAATHRVAELSMGGAMPANQFGSEVKPKQRSGNDKTLLKKRTFSGVAPDQDDEDFSDLYSDSFERRDIIPDQNQFAPPSTVK